MKHMLSLALSAVLVQSSPQSVSFRVGSDYRGAFAFDDVNVTMMALLNLDATLITALNCSECLTRVYNSSGKQPGSMVGAFQRAYPMPGISLTFQGRTVQD